MTSPEQPRIHLRKDGSIDTAYYLARGRKMRSEQAHRLLVPSAPDKRVQGTLLTALLALFFA